MKTTAHLDNFRIETNGYGEKMAHFELNGNEYSVEPTVGKGYYIKRQFGFGNAIDIHGTITLAVIEKWNNGKVITPVYGNEHFPCESDMNTLRNFAENFCFNNPAS